MISGSGTIGVEQSRGGFAVDDNTRIVRWFKITGGSNPYSADEVIIDESDGSRVLTGVYDVAAATKTLWEQSGNTSVPTDTIVQGTPNPYGTGFVFGYQSATTVALDSMPCLVQDGGEIVGLAQRWYNPATGVAECRTSGFCGCPPGEPPSPETSCCSLWYCTPDGPVEVSADGEGLYTPPEGWDGSKPHPSEAEALETCPPPPWEFDCHEEAFLIPAQVTFNFADLDPAYFALWGFNSVTVLIDTAPFPGAVYYATWNDTNGCTWSASVGIGCGIDGGIPLVAIDVHVGMPFGGGSCPSPLTFTGTSPWSEVGHSQGVGKTVTGGGSVLAASESAATTAYFTLVLTVP